jgi:glyoxylase-like metal-dependent hydrolase (beta-lactamase superfamily II)
MADYMDSLDKIHVLHPAKLYPGHGPVVDQPMPVLDYYIEHRRDRENQVIKALPGTPEELVERIYVDVDKALHPIATMSVRAHLAKLHGEGRAQVDADERWSLVTP